MVRLRQVLLYINSVHSSQETHYVSVTKTNRLMLFRETVAVYCENHTKQANTLCRQNAEIFYVKPDVHNIQRALKVKLLQQYLLK
jgi:hypothetical protein